MGSSVGDYEVLLSFRGVDTRQGFARVLHHFMQTVEIRVFMDDDSLEIGDEINSILEFINNSKICIPIFSPRFAESKWCLREVLRMVESKKTIVPIFYKVSPHDVKLKGESLYSDAFRELEKNHGKPEEVEKWKNALKVAASNTGRKLNDDNYIDFCKEFIQEVLPKLGPRKRLEEDENFVGDDNRETIIKLLEMESSSQEVICVGIYGMGGIGKTTITKRIYNELCSKFDHCAFLRNIREFTETRGIQELPNYLYESLEPKPVMRFSRADQIPDIFKKKKVLLILDDVDSYEQIKHIAKDPKGFGSGSRILLTTRDKEVITHYHKESCHEIRHLELKGLEDGWALKLFCKCVFRTDSPPSEFQELSKRVVSYSGGLPLTITVIGTSLRYREREEIWNEIINGLSKSLPGDVKKKLMISYECLEVEQKTIFLDIACCVLHSQNLHDNFLSDVTLMWQACSLKPHMSLEVLESKCLLKIRDGKISMHDQLRDMGMDIVKDTGGDITKQSRLWEKKDVLEVLNRKEKKKKIEAIQLVWDRDDDIMHYDFSGYDNLRFLVLNCTRSIISGTLPKLALLHLTGTSDVENLVADNLVVLRTQNNYFLLKVPLFIQQMTTLQVLEISDWCHRYQRLIDSSIIAKLQHLTSLSFLKCTTLVELPKELGYLRSLIQLNLDNCINLSKIPDSVGNLQSLKMLCLVGTNITSLPDSIGRLKKLETLSLSKCQRFASLPETLGNLHSLKRLDLDETKITSLPDSIGRLKKLEILGLRRCEHLASLPKMLGNLYSLKGLYLEETRITSLPNSIGRLKKLETLSLRKCEHLANLPETLGKLHFLNSLSLSTDVSRSDFIGKLKSLGYLNLSDCYIKELPKLPESLSSLIIKSSALKKVHDLSHLEHLTSLELQGGDILDWDGSFPTNLQTLDIELVSISRLPDFGNYSQLTCFTLLCQRSLKVLPNLSGLRKLDGLGIMHCFELIEIPGIGNLQSLTCLCIEGCPNLVSLGNLGRIRQLIKLHTNVCEISAEIPELRGLTNLTAIRVEHWDSNNVSSVGVKWKEAWVEFVRAVCD